MAYIPKQNEEDKNNQTGSAPTGSGAGVLSASGSPEAGSTRKQNFATLQSYLKTNKPQGEQFAGKLAEGVAQTGQQAQQGIEQTGQKLQSDIQGQTINYDPNIVKSAIEKPTEFVKNPENLETFTKYRTATYGGPQTAESTPEFQKAQADTQAALERSRLVDTEGGRKQLASEAQKSKAGGITALNQALLSTNPNAAATLQAAKTPFANLQTTLGSTAEQVNTRIKAAQDAAEQARLETTQGLAPLNPQLEKQLMEQEQKAIEARNTRNEAISQQSQWLTPLDTVLKGYNESAGKNYGDPLADFKQRFTGTTQTEVPTRATVATPEQYSYEAALEKLTGEPSNLLINEDVSKLPDMNQYKNNTLIDEISMKIMNGTSTPEDINQLRLEQNKPPVPNTNTINNDPNTQRMLKQQVANNYVKPALIDELRRSSGSVLTPRMEEYEKNASLSQLLSSSVNSWVNGRPGYERMTPEFRNLLDSLASVGVLTKSPHSSGVPGTFMYNVPSETYVNNQRIS